jgi:diguanylate cyclase (GGDEF)-like protein/PAS domain S-box-containing protein
MPVLRAYYTYVTLPLVPSIVWLLLEGEGILPAMGGLASIFCVLLVLAGRSINRQLIDTIKFRFVNADLASEIQRLNDSLEQRVVEKTTALRESEERFELAMRGANDGLWDWNIAEEKIYFSPRWKTMLGYQEHEISDSIQEWQQRLHPLDRNEVFAHIKAHVDGETDSYESIHRVAHKNGDYLWVLDRGRAVRDANGSAYRIVGTQADITDQKTLEEKLKRANVQLKHEIKERVLAQNELAHLAKHDPLTGLPNRILFHEKLQDALKRAAVEKEPIALLLVDLDNFKNVNDTLGHPVGDRLLVDVVTRLNTISNKNYFLSRFGGDEFFVILEKLSDRFLIDAYAREIADLVSQPFVIDAQELHIGCSIGVAIYPDHGGDPNQLIRDADIAMYQAKEDGKNTYRLFNDDMDRSITERVTLRNLLHVALEQKQFEVHYQPQVCVQTGRITGMEALLRWNQEEIGYVSPDRFIPILEETSAVNAVGNWILKTACKQAVQLQINGHPEFKVAVNMSPRQFLQEDLAQTVYEILTETGLAAHDLELEITENIFMEDLELIKRSLEDLKQIGVSIILDDFGTGFSSLGYLKRFPIDGLKIDKVFVGDLMKSSDSKELITAIIAMTKGLNIGTLVAEGVEDDKQLQFLREAGCPTYQGYLFSKPLPGTALERLVLKGRRLRSI